MPRLLFKEKKFTASLCFTLYIDCNNLFLIWGCDYIFCDPICAFNGHSINVLVS